MTRSARKSGSPPDSQGDVTTGRVPPAGPDSAQLGGRSLWAEVFLVTLFCGGLMAHLQFLTPHVPDGDSFFHMKVARLMRESGGPLVDFPWNQYSVFKEHFSDSSFLFHVLLIPFTFMPGDEAPIKWAAVVMGTLFFTSFFLFLRLNGCRFPALWMVLLVASGGLFLYRLLMARGYVLSMTLAIWGVHALLNDRRRLLFVVSFLYPLSYTAFQIMLFLAGFQVGVLYFRRDVRSLSPIGIVAAGCFLGLLVHPNFPHDFCLWWVQNVRVLYLKWVSGEPVPFGAELYAPTLEIIFRSTTTLVAILLMGYLVALVSTRERSDETMFLFLASTFFGILTMQSRRFVEYWAPLTVAFGAFLTRDLLAGLDLMKAALENPTRFWRLVTTCTLVAGGLMVHSYLEIREDFARQGGSEVRAIAQWLEKNTPANSVVFTCDWDDFPELFYWNHHNRYLVSLDPTFLYDFDRQVWKKWKEVVDARVTDLYEPIRRDFGSRHVFCTKDMQPFIQRADLDPRFTKVLQTQDAVLYELGDNPAWLKGWAVSGPYRATDGDYAELDRLMLTNLGFREGALPATARFHPWKSVSIGEHGAFLDLGRNLESGEACAAYAITEVESPIDQQIQIAYGYDDGFVLWVNGAEVAARKGPHDARVDEEKVGVEIKAGMNRLVVRCQNFTNEWGFYLRVASSPVPVLSMVPEL